MPGLRAVPGHAGGELLRPARAAYQPPVAPVLRPGNVARIAKADGANPARRI